MVIFWRVIIVIASAAPLYHHSKYIPVVYIQMAIAL